jgi:protocatechuate 3,4-dioxygenase beta subunit
MGDLNLACWLIALGALSSVFLGSLVAAQDSPPLVGFAELLEQAPLVTVSDEVGTADTAGSENSDLTLDVRGRILDEDGQSIADAVVVIYQAAKVLARTRADAEGQYRLEDVRCPPPTASRPDADGTIMLAQIVGADARGRLNWEPIKYCVLPILRPVAGYRYSTGGPIPNPLAVRQDVLLGEPRAITGVVLNPQKIPVADVEVGLSHLLNVSDDESEQVDGLGGIGNLYTVTDAEGKFCFPHVPAGMIAILQLKHPDFYPSQPLVGTSPDVTALPSYYAGSESVPLAHSPAQLHLVENVILRGRIVNQKQEPLPGAEIQKRFSSYGKTKSDSQGNFEFAVSADWLAKQSGRETVTAFDVTWPADSPYTNFTPSLSRQQIVDTEVLTIVAENAIEIRGQVIASNDQIPVADLPVRIEPLQYQRDSRIETQTDVDGRFTAKANAGRWIITCGPKAGFDLLATNKIVRQGDAVDPKSQRTVDLIASGQPKELAIIIDRTPETVINVVDPTGQPIAGAKLTFWRAPQRGSSEFNRRTSAQSIVPEGTTDELGVCKMQLPTLLDENWVVTASCPADVPSMFALKEIRSTPNRPIEMKMIDGVPVQGRVLWNNAPLENAVVRLSEYSLVRSTTDAHACVSTMSTNEAGEYKFFLPTSAAGPGPRFESDYTIELVKIPEFTQCRRPTHRVSTRSSRDAVGGAALSHDFIVTYANGEASGRIVDESGDPIVGATVRAYPDSILRGDDSKQAYATTDEPGFFHWSGLGIEKLRPMIVILGKPSLPEIKIHAGQEAIEIVVPAEDRH